MEFLKSIDIYPNTLSFYMKKSQTFTTCLGGILGIIMVALFIIFFILFGLDLFRRTNPNINQQRLTLSRPQPYNLKPQELAINFTFYGVNKITNFNKVPVNYFNIEFYLMDQKVIERAKFISNNISEDGKSITYSNNMSTTLFDFFTSGDTFSLLRFEVNICSTKTFKDCDLEFMKNFLQTNDVYLSLTLFANGVDVSNVEKPLNTNKQNFFIKLNPQVSKNMFFTFKKIKIHNDLSWLFQTDVDFEGQDIDSFFEDFNSISPSMNYNLNLFNGIIIYGRTLEIYSISYLKIQDIFAKVGGILNIIHIIFKIIAFYYSKHKLEKYIVKCCLSEKLNVSAVRSFIPINNLKPKINKDIKTIEIKKIEIDKKDSDFKNSIKLKLIDRIKAAICRCFMNKNQIDNFLRFDGYLKKTMQLFDVKGIFELNRKIDDLDFLLKKKILRFGYKNISKRTRINR